MKLLAPVQRLDAAIQRAVNAAAFWLMRRGVPKSLQTYGLVSAMVAGCVASLALSRERLAWWLLLLVPVTLGWVWLLHANLRSDQRAEARGRLSANDRPDPWIWKIWGPALAIGNARTGDTTPAVVAFSVAMTAHFLEQYLRRTPRQPPPEEERAPSHLATEGA